MLKETAGELVKQISSEFQDTEIRVFRTATVDDSLEYADGRWRFLLFDMDYSCEDYTHNTLLYTMGEVGRFVSERIRQRQKEQNWR